MLKLGIDDSGRGPTIGPMILAGCLIDKNLEKELKKLGVKDSKLLNKDKREILAEIIRKKAFSYHIAIVSPTEIDGKISIGFNLNRIEAVKSARIINKINRGLDKINVIVDCPSPNTKKWGEVLKTYVNKKDNLIFNIEHKADLNHIACSAASIIAKSTREKEIKKIKDKIGKDFGSGYPSDPITRKFLKDHVTRYKKEGIFRKSWVSWKQAKMEKEQKKLGEY